MSPSPRTVSKAIELKANSPGVTATRKLRVAYVVSHPIQYQAGLLRQVAAQADLELLVIFCSDFSVKGYRDAGFAADVTWDTPLLEGYSSIVLRRWRETSNPGPTRPIAYGFLHHLRRGMNGKPFDAVWVHGYSTVNSIHAILAAKALGLPVLLRAESWLYDRERSRLKLLVKRAFFLGLRTLVNAVLPIGTQNAAYWARYLGDDFPAFFMPYAVDNNYFATGSAAALSTRSDLQQELGLSPGRPVILFASKLQERKHCDHLLHAYLRLRQASASENAPCLLIVGEGEMRTSLEQHARESGCDGIVFAGFRNQGELLRIFDLSTVFVLPSRHEPWGLITNEAMACGLPVIVTEEAGCAVDLVRQSENGFVYPAGDIAALCDALAAVLQPGEAERMGLRSREIISQWSYTEDVDGLRAALRFVTGIGGASRADLEAV